MAKVLALVRQRTTTVANPGEGNAKRASSEVTLMVELRRHITRCSAQLSFFPCSTTYGAPVA